MARRCQWCNMRFANRFQLGPHARVCSKKRVTCAEADADVVLLPVKPEVAEIPVLPQEIVLHEICRRTTDPKWGIRVPFVFPNREHKNPNLIYDYTHTQREWNRYIRDAHSCYPSDFWKVYESVKRQTINCRDAVLSVVKKVLPGDKASGWPSSCRTLREKVRSCMSNFTCLRVNYSYLRTCVNYSQIKSTAGVFWDHVTATRSIDLSSFRLGHLKSVKFVFMDPISVFIRQCNELCKSGATLVWDPVRLLHPTNGHRIFGAGIECGRILYQATRHIPTSGKVALLSISWDGGNTGINGRSAAPICVQIMNVNGSSAVSVGLLGYVPYLEIDSKFTDAKKAKQYILQTCIGYVLDAIESRARYGFRCYGYAPIVIYLLTCYVNMSTDCY